jgi:hypothetical protein
MVKGRVRVSRAFVVLVAVAVVHAHASVLGQSQKDDDKDPPNQQELELKACGPKGAKSTARTDKKNHPTPEPPPDMGLVYVVRPTMMGNKVQTKLGVGGRWLGVNRGNNYFYITLPPGEHYVCSQAENRHVITLTVEAGKTYYLQQRITMGFMKARTRLEVLDEEEGVKALARTHLSVSEDRQ